MGADKKHRNKNRGKRAAAKPVSPGRESAPAESLTAPDWLALLALCMLVAVSFFPATMAGFVWDDRVFTETRPVRDLSGILQIWFEPNSLKEYEGHYWPVLYTTFWLEHKLWGYAPLGYHLVNLLMHAGVTLLLWRLLQRLAVPGAWLAAAVFAVHPLHVESVVWVIGRKDMLAALFYLAAALCYIRFLQDGQRHWRRYIGALALFLLGLLSKSTVLTLPVSLWLWHWWKLGRVTAADFARTLPFLLLGLAVTIIDWLSYKDIEILDLGYSAVERMLIAAQALWFYAAKLVWPAGLIVIYPHFEVSADHLPAWGYLIAAVALAALLWFARQRIGRGPLAGALFFVITLSPTLGFIDYGYMQFSFVADRYQYLAGAGIITLVVAAATRGALALPGMWKTGASVLAVAPLIILGALTWQQAGIYRHEGAFFGYIVSHNPQARSAHYNLGGWYKDEGRNEEALATYRLVLEKIDPSRPADAASTYINMGVTYENMEQYEQAEEYYRRALQAKPRAKNAMYNLARLLTGSREYEESLRLYRQLLKIDPRYVNGHAGIAVTLAWLERPEEALRSLERVETLDPSRRQHGTPREQLNKMRQEMKQKKQLKQAGAHYQRALEYRQQGRMEDALAALSLSREQSPDSVEIPATMGFIAEEMGRLDEAATHYQRALEIDPRFPEALNHLGALRLRQQRYQEALDLFQTLLEIKPDFAKVYSGMGVALFNLNRSEEALQSFEKALSLDPSLEEARINRNHALQRLGQGSERLESE